MLKFLERRVLETGDDDSFNFIMGPQHHRFGKTFSPGSKQSGWKGWAREGRLGCYEASRTSAALVLLASR